MKKYCFAVLALMLSLPATAGWIAYHRAPDTEEFYDADVDSRDQGRITLWTLTDYATPITSLEAREVASEKSLTTIDCAAQKIGSTQVVKFSGRQATGEIVGTMKTPLRMTPVREGSPDKKLLELLCR